MRHFHSLALASALSCVFASAAASAATFTLNTTDEYGKPLVETRSYTVYRPAGLSTATPVPAIVVLLGSGSLTATADKYGFVVVTASFSGNSSGNTSWINGDPRISGPEDYDYLDQVLQRVKTSDNVND